MDGPLATLQRCSVCCGKLLQVMDVNLRCVQLQVCYIDKGANAYREQVVSTKPTMREEQHTDSVEKHMKDGSL